jgi:hypothetical protein
MKLSKEVTTEDATDVHGESSFKMSLTKWLMTMLAAHNELQVMVNVNL